MDIVKINISQYLSIRARITSTGWDLAKEDLTGDQWQAAGAVLIEAQGKFKSAWQWALGDWWNANKWGDGRAACEKLGIEYQTARDCGWVAKQFQFSRRRENLTFSHHHEACSLDDPHAQDQMLDWAEETNASSRVLREEVQKYKALVTEARKDPRPKEPETEGRVVNVKLLDSPGPSGPTLIPEVVFDPDPEDKPRSVNVKTGSALEPEVCVETSIGQILEEARKESRKLRGQTPREILAGRINGGLNAFYPQTSKAASNTSCFLMSV